MLKILWDENALNRHEEWALNIALEYSFSHAQSYLHDIEKALTHISNNPKIGIQIFENNEHFRRHVTPYGYSVIYELNTSTTIIIKSIIRGYKVS